MKKGIAITVIPFFYIAIKNIVIIKTIYISGLRSICVSIFLLLLTKYRILINSTLRNC